VAVHVPELIVPVTAIPVELRVSLVLPPLVKVKSIASRVPKSALVAYTSKATLLVPVPADHVSDTEVESTYIELLVTVE
jgi:hypothetical protein